MIRARITVLFLSLLSQVAWADSWDCYINKHLTITEQSVYDRYVDFEPVPKKDRRFVLRLEKNKLVLPQKWWVETGDYTIHHLRALDDGWVSVGGSLLAENISAIASYNFWQGTYQPVAYFIYSKIDVMSSQIVRAHCRRKK
jgi:hypothetical protein